MDNEILEILKRLESKLDENTNDIKEIKSEFKEIKSEFKEIKSELKEIKSELEEFQSQFFDFEGKSSANHAETISKFNDVQKDIGKLTNVTKTNCFEIADLKAVK